MFTEKIICYRIVRDTPLDFYAWCIKSALKAHCKGKLEADIVHPHESR